MRRGAILLVVCCTVLMVPRGPLRAAEMEHYRLQLVLDPDSQTLAGTAYLDVECTEAELPGNPLVLDFVGMTVTAVRVDGETVPFSRVDDHLQVYPPEGGPWFSPGESAQVAVDYEGTPEPYVAPWGTWGVVFEEDKVFTVNVTEGARTWFPCRDRPDDKASFELELTVPEAWEVAAPGALLEVTAGEGVRTFHWLADWPLATYLMHFAAGPYAIVEEEHGGIPFQYYLYPTPWEEAEPTLAHAPPALAMLEARYGAYPFPKVAFDEINLGGAVEQPSCVSLGTQIFAAPEDFADVIAHELSHSWFQGVVTVGDWRDIWLSEGMATYHEALYFAAVDSPEAGVDWVESLGLSYRLVAESSEGIFPMYDSPVMWGVTVYRKGACVLHMLRYLLGDETFDAVLNEYLTQYAWQSVTTADFRQVAQEVSGRDLVPFFDEWVYGQGYPQLAVGWEVLEDGRTGVYVRQEQPEDWALYTALPLEFEFVAADDVGQQVSMALSGVESWAEFDLGFQPTAVTVDPNRWWLKKTSEIDYVAPPVSPEPGPEHQPEPAADVVEAPADVVPVTVDVPPGRGDGFATAGDADGGIDSGGGGGGCGVTGLPRVDGGWLLLLLASCYAVWRRLRQAQ